MLLTENIASKISLENIDKSGKQEMQVKMKLHWSHKDNRAVNITSSHCRPSGQTEHSSPLLWPRPPCSCSLLGWPGFKTATEIKYDKWGWMINPFYWLIPDLVRGDFFKWESSSILKCTTSARHLTSVVQRGLQPQIAKLWQQWRRLCRGA